MSDIKKRKTTQLFDTAENITMINIELRLDELYAQKVSCIGRKENFLIYQSIMCECLPSNQIMQKFVWFQVYPLNYNDGHWEQFK